MTFWVAGAIVGSSVIGGISANKAANTQVAAADRAAQLQQQQFDKNIELQAPWRQAGVNALGKLQSGDVMGQMDPSYQFRLSEGMKALERTAASRGGLLSGATLKGAQRYGQGLASQEYGNAYNRLASMAGIGQTATGAMTGLGSQFANAQGENYMGAANARASGYTGGANAVSGGLGQYLGYSNNQNLMNMLRPKLTGGVQGMGQINPMDGEYMGSLTF